MDNLNTISPLSYQDWSAQQNSFSDLSQKNYLDYLNNWYNAETLKKTRPNLPKTKKEEYIQLVKDLTVLLNPDERDLFLTDIDYSNDEDLIYIIPFLAHKLKEISQILASKRENLKYSKTKNSMTGSNEGLEKVLYEYILKNFTKKEYSYTRIPLSPLQNLYPQLSSVSEDFFIEIEELYDTNSYHDSDPSLPISTYADLSAIVSTEYFKDLTEEEIFGLISTRYLPRVAETPLSTIFKNYLNSVNTNASTVSSFYTSEINNLYGASQKYLGETVYGLTAVKTGDVVAADLALNFDVGNNWFYWPYGDKILDETLIGNTYRPIPINSSNLLLNRQVTGSSYLDSDLIFTDKNGVIEGAWLQGTRTEISSDVMSIRLKPDEVRTFIFPYVGYQIASKTLNFIGYSLNDSERDLFEKLSKELKKDVLNSYFTGTIPNSASLDIYLNQTSLIKAGSYAAKFSDEADVITKRVNNKTINNVYQDNALGTTEQAFLYKFQETDIAISEGDNIILWPIKKFTDPSESSSLTLNHETCLPINVGDLESNISMLGSTAGTNITNSDVIYKLNNRTGLAESEAAWLAAGTNNQLDLIKDSIQIYSTPALDCAEYIEGAIQSSLSFKVDAGSYLSFIWMDKDTPADDVFLFRDHAYNCPFGKTFPHNFYSNQDYQNVNPLNANVLYPLDKTPCTCKAVNYSPMGHEGTKVSDYNGMSDYLFADPFGLGSNFTLNTWKDTRRLNVYNSPQFSFYQLDGKYDKEVGFGTGKWKNGDNTKMILKTGRRYTYYRTGLRSNPSGLSIIPYLISNYAYKNITVTCGDSNVGEALDLVIIIDKSKSEYFDLATIKDVAKSFCSAMINQNKNALISIISFANDGDNLLTYLTNSEGYLISHIDSIKVPNSHPTHKTNLYPALALGYEILNTNQPDGNNCNYDDISALCSNLNAQILNRSNIPTLTNCPRPFAKKKFLILSDGEDNISNINFITDYVNEIKDSGIEIISMDVGAKSGTNTLMETIATDGLYYNLNNYLLNSDGNYNNFVQYTSLALSNCQSIPRWCKAIKDKTGIWQGTIERSSMVLNAGDYINYSHRPSVTYNGSSNGTFVVPSITFTINIKLDGWDYTLNKFDPSFFGAQYGAKPFWGISYVDTNAENNFFKGTMGFGGHIKFIDGYAPVNQPEISNMILDNGCLLEYSNRGNRNILWQETLTFNVFLTSQRWNKLIIDKSVTNLDFAVRSGNIIDLVVESSQEESNMTLESYNSFKPARYNYYAINPINISQTLYNLASCSESFSVFLTGVAINANEPYLNLDNIHYPTVATFPYPYNLVSKNQTGAYLSPDKLGVSYYRGKGYEITINPNRLTYTDSLSVERMFLDPNKYASRHRGLTKNDQLSITEISNVDNNWMIESYTAGNYSGVILDTLDNQKLTPYQSTYETDKLQVGLSLMSDSFQFWNPQNYNRWVDASRYPLTFKKELTFKSYNDKLKTLLVDIGVLDRWRVDIFGNNYGLFK
jgi:hypothetical protein